MDGLGGDVSVKARVDTVKATLRTFAMNAGFVYARGAYYRDQIDTIAVIDLQRSNYSPRYFVNVGLWVKALGHSRYPPEESCHVRTRLTQLTTTEPRKVESLLDLDEQVDDKHRGDALLGILQKELLPILDRTAKISALVGPAGRSLLDRSVVRAEARKYLVEQGASTHP
jgi:hypothetical protein